MAHVSQSEYRSELRQYVLGYGMALALSAIPFACVAAGVTRSTSLIVILVAGLIQVVVHFRLFLHIDLSRSKRDDLQLILFSTLLVLIMVGGTIWILADQHARMM